MANQYAGRGAGAYGALGGIITFEWVPDPNVVANKIMTLAGYLENFIPPLEASRGVARADMQNHFDTESSPSGEAWAELSEEYVATRGSDHPILQLTGAMHAAAVSESAYIVDAHDLFFSTAGLPAYSFFHESGRGSGAEDQEFVAKARALLEEAGITPAAGFEAAAAGGGAMPARPFMGFSLEAELQILEIFDAWFSGAVAGFYTSGRGTVQRRETSGRFGPAITGE